MGLPPNGLFIRENPIRMNALGTPTLGNLHMAMDIP